MPSLNTLRTITVRQISEGAATVRRDLDGLVDAQERVAKASETTATVTEMASRRQLSASAAYDRLRSSVDESFRAQQRMEQATRTLDRAMAQGVIDATGYDRTLGQLQARYGGLAGAAAAAAKSQRDSWRELTEMGRTQLQNVEANSKLRSLGSTATPVGAANKNGRLRADQVQNLAYQGSDIISSLGSGASPMTVLLQQGTQVGQVFGGPGGASVKGAFAQAGEAASGFASRIGIVGGAIGIVGAATLSGIAALISYRNAQGELQQSLAGVGRASGATVGQINALAPAAAAAGNVSLRSARQMAGEYASTGKIGTEMFTGLIGSAKDFAATTGQDLPEANKALATAFADPAKGADALNERLGFLNDTTRETIQRLQAQGDRLGAQKVLFDAYKTGLTSATELTSGWGRAISATLALLSDGWDRLGKTIDRSVTGGALEDQFETAKRNLALAQAAQSSRVGNFRSPGSAGGVSAAEAEMKRVNAMLDQQNAKIELAQRAERSRTIGDVVRTSQPERAELKKLQDQAELVRKSIADPIKFGLDRSALTDTTAAFETMSRAIRNMNDDISRFGSTAVAALNRTAEFNNRTVGYAPTARATAQINQDFDEKERNADSRELSGLRRAREIELETARRQALLESSSGSGRYSMGVGQAPEQYRDTILASSNASGVNADLLAAQIRRESRFNPNAVSSAGAQGISQFMPQTARGMGLSDPFNPTQAIMKQGELMAQLLKQFDGNEVAALVGYNAGPRTAQRFLASGSDVAMLPQETRDYIKAILTPPHNSEQMVKELDSNAQAVKLANDNLRTNTDLYGKNGLQLDATTRANQMLSEQLARGVPLTDALKASIGQFASESASAAQKLKLVQFANDVGFDREQLGRTGPEQSAYARARSLVGDTSTPGARIIIDQQLQNDGLREAKATLTDAVGGFAQDLRRGASAADAFSNVLGRVADRALNGLTDSLVSGLFKVGGSGGASGGGLLDSIGGGLKSLFGFASGGVMTSRGPVPLHAYASGGIANSPQMALFGEGRMPEAYVPLPDGKRIPVAMSQPANANGGGTVTVSHAPVYNVTPAAGVTPEQLAAVVDRNNQQFAKSLPSLIQEANRRRAG